MVEYLINWITKVWQNFVKVPHPKWSLALVNVFMLVSSHCSTSTGMLHLVAYYSGCIPYNCYVVVFAFRTINSLFYGLFSGLFSGFFSHSPSIHYGLQLHNWIELLFLIVRLLKSSHVSKPFASVSPPITRTIILHASGIVIYSYKSHHYYHECTCLIASWEYGKQFGHD